MVTANVSARKPSCVCLVYAGPGCVLAHFEHARSLFWTVCVGAMCSNGRVGGF
ncbi:hypothetical protein DPMN_122504 [Dreissena polymorpha]|uniref:Uncharacterized protein n=1 Tax=Dreissena polymorpha TaxID=45954 RepID=A0A9D4GSM1_DREPO|nr:hypothetical protein DPMN_121921 [Dreissena polymorpha]KAH3820755.1 hypothetical protein DPMN_122504 [Dreissena polymorpha]